jgi:hypothetical protein
LAQFGELPPPSHLEAQVSLAAFLSVIGAALSLAAPFTPAMLVFAPLALILAIWSLAHTQFGATAAPREFRWLAWAGLTLSAIWIMAWMIHLALLIA